MISGVRASSTRIEFDLVDDRVVVAALHHRLAVVFHVVAEIVEAELVVGGVGDVGGIGGLAFFVGQAVDDDADGQAEELVDAAHPFRVAPGEIVVDGDDMDALAFKRVEIDGQRRHQRLALAGAHLRDAAIVKDHAADSWTSKGRMSSTRREASRTVAKAGTSRSSSDAPLARSARNCSVRARSSSSDSALQLVLHGVDRLDPGTRRLDAAIVGGAEDLAGENAETDHQMVLSTVFCRRAPAEPAGTRQAEADSNSKKRPENGSGRKDAGQIRGATSDVNARIRAIWR